VEAPAPCGRPTRASRTAHHPDPRRTPPRRARRSIFGRWRCRRRRPTLGPKHKCPANAAGRRIVPQLLLRELGAELGRADDPSRLPRQLLAGEQAAVQRGRNGLSQAAGSRCSVPRMAQPFTRVRSSNAPAGPGRAGRRGGSRPPASCQPARAQRADVSGYATPRPVPTGCLVLSAFIGGPLKSRLSDGYNETQACAAALQSRSTAP
jgi:hypothetical protein